MFACNPFNQHLLLAFIFKILIVTSLGISFHHFPLIIVLYINLLFYQVIVEVVYVTFDSVIATQIEFSLLHKRAEYIKIYTDSAKIPAAVMFVSYLKFLNFTNILACKNIGIVLYYIIFGRMYLEPEWVYPVHHWHFRLWFG